MKSSIKVICGVVAGIMIGGATVVCANQAIQAMQNTEIKVSLNGEVQEFKDETTGERQYPITYNNRTYLPLRNVASLSGLMVDYDANNNEAKLTDDKASCISVGILGGGNELSYANGKIIDSQYSIATKGVGGKIIKMISLGTEGEYHSEIIYLLNDIGDVYKGILNYGTIEDNEYIEFKKVDSKEAITDIFYVYDIDYSYDNNPNGVKLYFKTDKSVYTLSNEAELIAGYDESDKTTKIENNKNVTVVDATNYTDGYYDLFKVRLPKIVGNTSTISALNNQMLSEVLRRTYSDVVCHAETDGTAMDKGSMYDYKYTIKDDILIIYIFSSVPEGGSLIPASGGGLQKYSYFYDIKNDKALTVSQAAKTLNMSLDNVVSFNGEKIDSYDKLDNNEFVVEIDGDDIKLVSEL